MSDDDGADAANPDPDQAWKALTLVNEWLRFAEAKAGAVIAAAGVSGGVVYNLVKSVDHPPWPISAMTILCVVFIVGAGVCAAMVFVPRRKNPGQPEDFSNLLFYSHITKQYANDEPTYADVLGSLTSNRAELTRHIANQVHANSGVAHCKFNWATWGIFAIIGALSSLGILAALVGWHFNG
ncbi:Pycsar system effector family protein [Mycolicibacterium sp. CR10]|uniref:Pycsar system effector family protein n=1 Tax=Mycolicibacterium sp. CR10 TaxID=2562314 RepID=UPI0010C075A3|nr:Pycsar system effector family protein [Mycolicibacterium sp. CR10]